MLKTKLIRDPVGCLYSGGLSLFSWTEYFGGLSLIWWAIFVLVGHLYLYFDDVFILLNCLLK